MKGYFITATDTDAGKTFVTSGLLQGLSKLAYKVQAYKPVASGCDKTPSGLRNDDALQLMTVSNAGLDYDKINSYSFASAIAPHIAADKEGVSIHLQTIIEQIYQSANDMDYVLVEGVGGWQVPLNDQETIADLAKLLAFPIIMIVNMRLGCINHALLTAQSIEQSGLNLAGWIANQTSLAPMEYLDDNIKSIQTRIKAPLLGMIPNIKESQQVTLYIDLEKIFLSQG